jgi:putative protease
MVGPRNDHLVMSCPPPYRPELLAPAGDWESLHAAVANGADAVYFGLPAFNARQRATNFTLAELPDVLACLHDHNAHGYVALNTLIFSDELPRAAEYLRALAEAGADAVIVQDLGLLGMIRRLVPTLPIHASTQMTQTEARGIEVLRTLGVRRVILARELSLAEIAAVRQQTMMPLEVFVHGALCISYSGQCQASEALWGRSANRGVCGQACRLPYQLVLDGQPFRRAGCRYPLSPQDLAAYDRLPQLLELGVAGLKIEGRLKSAQYVAAATRVYRTALDAALRGESFVLPLDQQAELVQSFSRGLCHGYLDGVDHRRLVAGQCPKKRGLHVADVVANTDRGVVVRLTAGGAAALKPGEGVVFDEGHPERDEQGGRIFSVAPLSDRSASEGHSVCRLTFGRGAVNLAAVAVGAKVWKTDDPAIRQRLQSSYRRDFVARRTALHFRATAQAGEPLRVQVCDDAGHALTVAAEQPLVLAEKHPLTVTLLRAQWGRLGNTPFELGRVELRGAQGSVDRLQLMVPKSVLNDLRRRAVHALQAQRAAAHRHRMTEADALGAPRGEIKRDADDADTRPQLHVLARTPEQLDAVLAWKPAAASVARGIVYCDFRDAGDYAPAIARGRVAGRPIGLATPWVIMPGAEHEISRLAKLSPAAVLVRNLGALHVLGECFPHLALVGGVGLNVANELAARELLARGVRRWTPARELAEPRLSALLALLPAASVELPVHVHGPLFHTRHCLFAASLSDGPRCGECFRRCRSHTLHLRDRRGALYPVSSDGLGHQTVFGPPARTAAAAIARLHGSGLLHYRVELFDEAPADVGLLLDSYVQMLAAGAVTDSSPVPITHAPSH